MNRRKFPKIIYLLVCFLLIFEQSGFAQIAAELDIAGRISAFHHALTVDRFRPLHLRYLQYDLTQNNFKLLLDKGTLKNPSSGDLENTSKELLKYFLIGISLPNDSFWVNLRPDAQENIIDDYLAQTDVGKIMLESDLQLKQDTAKFTSPQTPEGRQYWDKLYQKAGEVYGSQNITIPTLTRPWIVPDEIIIRETTDSAYVYKATLKVMLEQDYLKDNATYSFKDPREKQLNEYSSQLIRETIIPKLIKEINTSKRYASLRQVYYSLILAQWFKARFAGKADTYSKSIDKKDLTNLTSKQPWSKTTYFEVYQKSFKDGEYNLKEPVSTPYGQVIRSYFSGGMQLGEMVGQPGAIKGLSNGGSSVSILGPERTIGNPTNLSGVEINADEASAEGGMASLDVVRGWTQSYKAEYVKNLAEHLTRGIQGKVVKEKDGKYNYAKAIKYIDEILRKLKPDRKRLLKKSLEDILVRPNVKNMQINLANICLARLSPNAKAVQAPVSPETDSSPVIPIEGYASKAYATVFISELVEILYRHLSQRFQEKLKAKVDEIILSYLPPYFGDDVGAYSDNKAHISPKIIYESNPEKIAEVLFHELGHALLNDELTDIDGQISADFLAVYSLGNLRLFKRRGAENEYDENKLTKLLGDNENLKREIWELIERTKKDWYSKLSEGIQLPAKLSLENVKKDVLDFYPPIKDIIDRYNNEENPLMKKRLNELRLNIEDALTTPLEELSGSATDIPRELAEEIERKCNVFIGAGNYITPQNHIKYSAITIWKEGIKVELNKHPLIGSYLALFNQGAEKNEASVAPQAEARVEMPIAVAEVKKSNKQPAVSASAKNHMSAAEEEANVREAGKFFLAVGERIKQKTGKNDMQLIPPVVKFVDQRTDKEELLYNQLKYKPSLTSEESGELERLNDKIGSGMEGEYSGDENVIRLNRQIIDKRGSIAAREIYSHEDLHAIRSRFIGVQELNAGYNNVQKYMVETFLKDENEQAKVVPAYITEFFSQLDEIILKELGVEGVESRKRIDLKGLRGAARYLDGGFNKKIYEILDLNEQIFKSLDEIAQQDNKGTKDIIKELDVVFDQYKAMINERFTKLLEFRNYLDLLCPDKYPQDCLYYLMRWFFNKNKEPINAKEYLDTLKDKLNNPKSEVIDELLADLRSNINNVRESIENGYLKQRPELFNTNSNTEYLIAQLAISENYETIRNDWERIFIMDAKDVESVYFNEAFKKEIEDIIDNYEKSILSQAPAAQDLGAQVSNIKRLDRLLRILNVLRKSEKVTQISQDASDRDIVESCIAYLDSKNLITTQSDADGNLIITIKNSAFKHSDMAVRKFANAIRAWAINSAGGVKAINFQGKDNTWKIIGFATQLNNPKVLKHEQEEIRLRKQGYDWKTAHKMTGGQLEMGFLNQGIPGQEVEIGAAVDGLPVGQGPVNINTEDEKQAIEFLKENSIDIEELNKDFGEIIQQFGYSPFKKLYEAAQCKNVSDFIALDLSSLKELFKDELKTYWPDIVRLGISSTYLSGYLFRTGLPALKELFKDELKTYWPDLVKLGVAAGPESWILFRTGLPALKELFKDELKTYWPDLVKLGVATGEQSYVVFFQYLFELKNTFSFDELKTYWPGLLKLGIATAGNNIEFLFKNSLRTLKLNYGQKKFETYWPDLIELGVAAGSKAWVFFEYGLPAVEYLITDKDSLNRIGNDLIKIFQLCEGVEINTADELKLLNLMLKQFPSSWGKFIKPVIYNQTAGAFLCFRVIHNLYEQKAIQSEDDLEFIKELIFSQGVGAYDILANFLEEGVSQGVIAKPISKEKETIEEFLSQSRYFIPELYQAYKNNPEELDSLVARCDTIYQKILQADTSDVENDPFFPAILIHVFPPVVTAQREQYANLYKSRPDRPQDTKDIPSDLQGKVFNVSTGIYVLKDPSRPLDETPWKGILDIVREVNKEEVRSVGEDQVRTLGKELLEHWQKSTLHENRSDLLGRIYRYYRYSRGAMLPESLTTITNIMALKEFIGDTLCDLITECVNKYQESDVQGYQSAIDKMFKTRIDNPAKVAKAVWGVLKQFKDTPERAKGVLRGILRIEDEEALDNIWELLKNTSNVKEIEKILAGIIFKKQSGKEAQIISRHLQGEEYNAMQGEVSSKYKFNASREKLDLHFIASKRKAHGVVGLNMGVCVAPDKELWDNPNFMNVIIFDQNNIARGGMHILIIEDDGKSYLTLPGINPNPALLAKVNSEDIYNKLISYAQELAKVLGCESVLIPASATIHSNRSEIQRVISARNYQKLSLSEEHEFSYSPFKYSFQDCFMVPPLSIQAPAAQDLGAQEAEIGAQVGESPEKEIILDALLDRYHNYQHQLKTGIGKELTLEEKKIIEDESDAILKTIIEASTYGTEAKHYIFSLKELLTLEIGFKTEDNDIALIVKGLKEREKKEGITKNTQFYYLVIKKNADNLKFLSRVIDDKALDMQLRLYALGLISKNFPKSWKDEAKKITSEEVDLYIKGAASLEKGYFQEIMHSPFAADELCVYNLALLLWAGDMNNTNRNLLSSIARNILGYKVERGGKNNAYSDFKVGQAFLEKCGSDEMIFTLTHELEHNILDFDYPGKLSYGELNGQTIHEFMSDLLTLVLAQTKDLNYDGMAEKMGHLEHYNTHINGAEDNEGHRLARAQLVAIQYAVGEDEVVDWFKMLKSAKMVLSVVPSGTTLTFNRFIEATLSIYRESGNAKEFANFLAASLNRASLEKEMETQKREYGLKIPIVEEKIAKGILSASSVGMMDKNLSINMAGEQIVEQEEARQPVLTLAAANPDMPQDAEAVAKMTRAEQEAALAWFYHGQEAGGMPNDVRRKAAAAFEKLPEGEPTEVRRGIRFNSEEEREVYLRKLKSDGYIPQEGAESFSDDGRTAEGASTSKAPVIIVWMGRTKPLRGVKNQLLQVLGMEGRNIDMSAEVEHIVAREGIVEKIINRKDGKIEVYVNERHLTGLPSIPQPIENLAGIDFRTLPIVVQAMSNLSVASRLPLASLDNINLNKELADIQRMVDAGITPSAERLKEYMQAACVQGVVDKDTDKVVACISDILRLEEERCCVTEPVIRDILVVLEAGSSSAELNQVFLGKTI